MAAPLVSAGFLNSLLFSGYTITLRMLHSKGESANQNVTLESANFGTSEVIRNMEI
jgi:hypothetical protein